MQKHLFTLCAFILSSSFFFSCSHVDRDGRKEFRKKVAAENFEQALIDLNKLDLAKNEKSQLLYLMELGLLSHLKGDYAESNEHFLKAQKKAQELYTTRISGKLTKFAGNDQEDFYYGENYEKSTIFFYMALNYYLIYQKTQDITDLRKAKSNLLAWDSVLKTIKAENAGENVFKVDLMAKLLGAQIHEAFDSTLETNTAINLYKEALDTIFKYYNAYPSYNTKSKHFVSNFKSLHEIPKDKVEQEYISAANEQIRLKEFIQERINDLSSNKKSSQKNISVQVLIENGLIPEKIPDVYDFSLEGAMNYNDPSDPEAAKNKQSAMMIGTHVLSAFMSSVLGLDSPNSGGEALAGVGSTMVAARYGGIKFELPKIDDKNVTPVTMQLIVYPKTADSVDSPKTPVMQKDLVLGQPLYDVAAAAIAEHSASDYMRVGSRVTMKHLTAILAAYATYKSFGQGNEFFGKTAALIGYTVASKAIAASEKADLRQWSTLAQDIHLTQIDLPQNQDYAFWINVTNKKTQEVIKRVHIGDYTQANNKNNVKYIFLSKRIF